MLNMFIQQTNIIAFIYVIIYVVLKFLGVNRHFTIFIPTGTECSDQNIRLS